MVFTKIKSLCFLILFILFSIFLDGCCSPRYNYYIYKKKGENALLAKNYKKAQNFFSVIYKKESEANDIDTERTTWAFYRLGVIAELSGNLKMAKGYYWGDSIDDSFYDNQRLVNWFAQNGWKQIDEKNKARTLEEILEFEKTEPPEEKEDDEGYVERKKEEIIPKTDNRPNFERYIDTTGIVTLTYTDSRTPPPEDVPEIFKVYY